MGVRERKQHLITVLSAHKVGGYITEEQRARFELMYRQARTPEEQDQVTVAVKTVIDGWKDGTDRYSRLRQAMNNMDPLADDEDDD